MGVISAAFRLSGGNMIKGVLFDMDGTMLDTEPISMACWRKSAAHFDITIDECGVFRTYSIFHLTLVVINLTVFKGIE